MTKYRRGSTLSEEDLKKSMESVEKQALSLLREFTDLGFSTLNDGSYEGNARGWIKSHVPAFNYVCGHGMPKGRVIEIFGQEQVGKTSIAICFAIAAQKLGGLASLIDVEHAAFPERFRHLGLDTDALLYKKSEQNNPLTVEDVYELLIQTTKRISEKYPELPFVQIWDSIAATPTRKELEEGVGYQAMGEHARLHSQGMRIVNQHVSSSNQILILINQERDKIGGFTGFAGPPQVTFGGKAIKFYSSIRLKVKKNRVDLEEDGMQAGGSMSVEAIKNKVAPPFRKVCVDLWFDERGFESSFSTLTLLRDRGFFEKDGGWTKGLLPSGKSLVFHDKDWESVMKENMSEILQVVDNLK